MGQPPMDQQVIAAWVQGVGSVAAIFAAIWIDQGAARRANKDRVAAAKATTASRLAAVYGAKNALQLAANEIRALRLAPNEGASLSEEAQRRLRGAKAVLDYHLRQIAEVDYDVLAGLALASEAFSSSMTWALSHQPFFGDTNAKNFTHELDQGARTVHGIYEDVFRELARPPPED